MDRVPKCKKCQFLLATKTSTWLIEYWCIHSKAIKLEHGCYKEPLYAKKMVTSPKWCPLRVNIK